MKCIGKNRHSRNTIPLPAQTGTVAVKTNWFHTCASRHDRILHCWGENEKGQTDVPQGIQVIWMDVGLEFTCALVETNTTTGQMNSQGQEMHFLRNQIRCWGDDTYGQLKYMELQGGVDEIASGATHVCSKGSSIYDHKFKLRCWGNNKAGQTDVPAASAVNPIKIACGYQHSCAIDLKFRVACWGWRTGKPHAVPLRLSALQVTAG